MHHLFVRELIAFEGVEGRAIVMVNGQFITFGVIKAQIIVFG